MPGTHIAQRPRQCAEKKVVYATTLTEPHLVLGGMYVDVNASRIQFEKQDKSWMPAVKQHVAVGLPNSV